MSASNDVPKPGDRVLLLPGWRDVPLWMAHSKGTIVEVFHERADVACDVEVDPKTGKPWIRRINMRSLRLTGETAAIDVEVRMVEVRMKATDITMDTPVGEVTDAVRRGDFTLDDVRAEVPRIDAEIDERRAGEARALAVVGAVEGHRKSVWSSRYVVGGDGSRYYLVKCGRASWRVDLSLQRWEKIA